MINLTVVEDNVTITVSEVGPTGPAGQGVPTGGTTGQVLTKLSGTNYATTWANNGTGTVTSVGITESVAALNITGSPVTSSGNINIGFAGTSVQYVAGDGSLITFPTTFDESKRLVTQVSNRSGNTMTKGTIVYINGAQGNLPTIAKSLATSDATSAQTLGFLQADIANNASGYVVISGKLENLDTSTIVEGTQLYLSSTIAGSYTTTKQYAPAHLVYVGVVTRAHPTFGVIEVKVQNGYELDEIHDVSARTPSNNDGIFFNTSTQLWENKSINTVLGVTPIGLTSLSGLGPVSYNNTNGQISMAASNGTVPGYLTTTDFNTFNNKISNTRSILTSAPLSGGGNLTTDRTISIYKSDTSTDGYLASTDFTNFNNKVSSSRQINTTAPLNGGGDLSNDLTISIPKASTLNDGYISSIDYVDLKNSIKQLGNQTIGYYALYSGTNQIGNSSVYESDGTLYLPASVNQLGLGNSKAVVTDGNGNTVSATIGTGLSLIGGILTATGTGTGSIGGTGTINYVPKFSATSSIGNSNIQDSGSLITLGSNTTISSGSLGIGTSTLTAYNLRITSPLTGGTAAFGVNISGQIQSDVTSTARIFGTQPSTIASAFTLGSLQHFTAGTTTIGASSSITNQYGFLVLATAIGATNNYAFSGQLAAATNTWNLYNSGTANNYMAGSLGIGSSSLANVSLRISKGLTGSTSSISIFNDGAIQSDSTTQATYFASSVSTTAASFTLADLIHYSASQSTIGAGSAVTNQYGYSVAANLIGATNNYAFRGLIPSGTGRWNLYMAGTADNYLAGNLGLGLNASPSAGPITSITLTNGGSGYVDGTYTNVTFSASFQSLYAQATFVVSGGIVTSATLVHSGSNYYVGQTLTTANTNLGGTGSGLVVTVATVDSSVFRIQSTSSSDISLFKYNINSSAGDSLGSIKWEGNDSSAGTSGIQAKIGAYSVGTLLGGYLSFFTKSSATFTSLVEAMRIGDNGAVGIGATTLTGYSLRISKNITGATTAYAIRQDGSVQSDVTVSASNFASFTNTAAASFTLGAYTHFSAQQGTIGAGSSITTQYGFLVTSNLIGATNNYAFFGNIPAQTNAWNIYMSGTANNYMAGALGIGTNTLTGYSLRVNKNPTGATVAYGISMEGTIQSDVTSAFAGYRTLIATLNSAFTLSGLIHFDAYQGTIGAGSSITTQYGFVAESNMIGATNNYGFYGAIPSGTNRWNIYMGGTAANYMAGQVAIGTTTLVATAALNVSSTTQGFLPPVMTTTQKNAIASPATGLIVFDSTLGKLCVFSTTWQTITSI
jgi:hypothetical protein